MTIRRPSPVPRKENTAAGTQDTTAGTQDTASPARDTARRGSGLTIALAVAVAVLLGASATFGALWWSEHRQAAQRDEVLGLAERIAVDVTSYDYRHIQRNFDRVAALSTDKWARVYRDERADQLAEVIIQGQAISEGTVRDAGIAELTEDRAVVVAFVDQTITNVHTPQPRIDRNRMRLTLRNVDGRWLLDRYDLA